MEVLSGAGFTELEAVNGMEAVEKALSREVDLVLMDICLQDINGYMAAKKIRKQKTDLRIIAQTAYSSNDNKLKVLNEGFDDYISKPMKQDPEFRETKNQYALYSDPAAIINCKNYTLPAKGK